MAIVDSVDGPNGPVFEKFGATDAPSGKGSAMKSSEVQSLVEKVLTRMSKGEAARRRDAREPARRL